MIVDTSAIVAIILDESDAEELERRLLSFARKRMSVASLLEAVMVVRGRRGVTAVEELDQYLAEVRVQFEPVTLRQISLARTAFEAYGKGLHPAALNFGDCINYALAKSLNEPLLFKGNDFSQTDIRAA
jgi:ribonuclease VapC